MILIFDTETTGLNGQVIEAAWLELCPKRFLQLEVINEYEERFKPSVPIEFGAMATHHILESDLVNCRPSHEFALPANCEFLIGHNIRFDWEVIGKPDVKLIDTLSLARQVWPGVSHTQSALMYMLSDDQAATRDLLKNAHSALADIRFCLFILKAIIENLKIKTILELHALSESALVPTVMPFGKHKGELIADIPKSYLSWFLQQNNIDPHLEIAFRRALQSKPAPTPGLTKNNEADEDEIPF